MPTPPAELGQSSGKHTLHRLFIGPLPDRVLVDAQHLVLKSVKRQRSLFSFKQSRKSPSDNYEPVGKLINQYAYAFHLHHGGSEGDWNEERENSVKDEMSRRWWESSWGRLWEGRREGSNASHARWVLPNDASSFQIGEFLGLDTYAELVSRSPRLTASGTGSSPAQAGPSTSRQAHLDGPSRITGDTFVTARSHISPEPELDPLPSQSSFFLNDSPISTHGMHVATSTTSLLRFQGVGQPPGRYCTRAELTDEVSNLKPALKARALASTKSDRAINGSSDTQHSLDQERGKKVVRFPRDDPSPPAPPGEVLQRTGSEMQETSAAAAEELQATTPPSAALLDAPDEYNDAKMKGEDAMFLYYLVMRTSHPWNVSNSALPATCLCGPGPDRMVVRVAYCKDSSLGSCFDEMQDRRTRDMQYEDWAEFMVLWRGDRLELYNNFVCFSQFPYSWL